MKLSETEVNNYLQSLLGRNEDSFQQAWVDILGADPQTLEEITSIVRKIRNRAIKQYFHIKHREVSLHKPMRKNGDQKFTLESILTSPTNETTEESHDGDNALYRKMVGFLMGQYFSQKNENLQLKNKEIELTRERLRLPEEWLRFKRDRYESWKKLMEEKGRQKENRFRIRVQLQRDKLEFRKKQLHLWLSRIQRKKNESRVRKGGKIAILQACPLCPLYPISPPKYFPV